MGHSMIHLNNNLLAAIDIQTTGPDPRRDNLIGVCVVPLDSFYNVYKQDRTVKNELECGRIIEPFDIQIQPYRVNNIHLRNKSWMRTLPKGINRNKILYAGMHGIDSFKAADLFDSWFQKLKLPWKKRLCLVSHNWIDKRPFLIDWLGEETYNQFFDNRYRDVVNASILLNDRADIRNVQIPFPKNFLTYLCSQLNIEYSRRQDLITNCVCLAQIYKELVKMTETPF